jgi:hypothetical protein
MPPALREPIAQRPSAKKVDRGDPLDEIERLIAETSSVDFRPGAESDRQQERNPPSVDAAGADDDFQKADDEANDFRGTDGSYDDGWADEPGVQTASVQAASVQDPIVAAVSARNNQRNGTGRAGQRPAAEPRMATPRANRPELGQTNFQATDFDTGDLDDAASEAEAAILASVAASRGDRVGAAPSDYDDEIEFDPDESRTRRARGGFGRVVAPVVALLLLAAAGGGIYWYLGASDQGSADVPLVVAQSEPVKIDAPAGQANPEGSNSVVFDQLDGSGGADTIERIVSRDQTGANGVRDVSRTITPDSDPSTLANRKVKTVTVRADGSIVTDTGATAGVEALPALRPNVPAIPGAISPDSASPDNIGAVITQLDSSTPLVGGQQGQGTARVVTTTAIPGVISRPGIIDNSTLSATPGTGAPALVAPKPIPRPPHLTGAGGAARVASAPNIDGPLSLDVGLSNDPLVLNQPAQSTQPAQPASAASGTATSSTARFYSQLASQPNRDTARASATELARTYASALGSRTIELFDVDLGSRGTWFRIGVPATSLSEANALCATIVSRGGDCIAQSR